MTSAISPSNVDQHNGYMPAYQAGMPPVPSPSKAQAPAAVVGQQVVSNGMDKAGEGGKDGQGPYSWAAAMEAYYKTGPQSHSHPGSYYGAPMAPPHHAYMWGAQPMMPPYGAPPPSPYNYGSMYPPQHPAMAAHPHPTTAYGYSATPQGQGKDVTAMAVAMPMGTPALPAPVPVAAAPGLQDQSATDVSSGGTDGGMVRRNKRSYETLTSNDAMAAMAPTPTSGTPSQYPYGSDMWNMSTPMQRTQSTGALATEVAPISYQDEREVKRQRRKQSNRESARRSRLRKQAEAEDLGTRVSGMVTDNANLRQELAQLQERCASLAADNARLREEAKAAGITLTPLSKATLPPPVKKDVGPLPPPALTAPEPDAVPAQQPPQEVEVAVAVASNPSLEPALGDAKPAPGAQEGEESPEANQEKTATEAAHSETAVTGSPAEEPPVASPKIKEEAPPAVDWQKPAEGATAAAPA